MTQVAILRHGERSWALFPGKPLIVGNCESCDLRIDLHGVARKHLKIGLLEDGSLHVRPLGNNRVEVDGRRIGRGTILPQGSSLVFGLAHLETHTGEAGFGLFLREALKENVGAAKKGLSKVPWLLASIAAHLLLIWVLIAMKTHRFLKKADQPSYGVETQCALNDEELRDNEEERVPDLKLVDPSPPPTPMTPQTFEELESALSDPDALGPGGSQENSSQSEALLTSLFPPREGIRKRGGSLANLSGALKRRIFHLRRTGLEIALCLDSTSSMGETIQQAKGSLKTIFLILKDLVPGARIAILAYRDKGDSYVVRKTRLGVELWEGLAFLSSIEAEGGGDFPEAVDEALVTANRLPWKRRATKVILIVGDAPPHEYLGISRSLRIAKIFQGRGGSVHTMLVGDDPGTKKAFSQIAEAGRGLSSSLGEDGSVGAFANLFLRLALGPTSDQDVPKMLAQWRKAHLLSWGRPQKKLRSLQLISTLKSRHPNPQIIEAWAHLGRRADIRRLLPQLRRIPLPAEGRHALIYIANAIFDRLGLPPLEVQPGRNPGEIYSKLKKRLGT